MSKDFIAWNDRKILLDKSGTRLFFHEREVWFASLGTNIGFEQDGKGKDFLRPVVILKKFNNELLWGIPTTKENRKGKYYFNFIYKEKVSTTAILSQLRLIDSKRLKYRIGSINVIDFMELKKRIVALVG